MRIRTVANEWWKDYMDLFCAVDHLKYEKKTYDEILPVLKSKYKLKDIPENSTSAIFEFDRRGFIMDVTVNKLKSGQASVLSMVTCHFTSAPSGIHKLSIQNLIKHEAQVTIQNKFPELFDNKTVYFIDAVELPIMDSDSELKHIHDEGSINSAEFTDQEEAIEAARIWAHELSNKNSNCICIRVIRGISNSRKRYVTDSTYRNEREVYTIGTKPIPETLLARRRYHFYPISVDEYVESEADKKLLEKQPKKLFMLTVAISDSRQFNMTTYKFTSQEDARNGAINAVFDWAEANEERFHLYGKYKFEYAIKQPDLIEVFSKSDKTRMTAMVTEITIE